jgi:hypothetical protein
MRSIINLFRQILAPAARKFEQGLKHPELIQKSVQKEIINRLINSEYGKKLQINSLEDWSKLPIVTYDDLAQYLDGKKQQIALTSEPILFYEKTSGSSGAVKYIPYTRSLRHSFNQMFSVWAYDLITNGPKFTTGKFYPCISPPLTKVDQQEIQNDLDYLDGWLRYFLAPWLIIPKNLTKIDNIATFKQQLALTLLKADRLEIISIWSPSFLQVHLNYITENRALLQAELSHKISQKRLKILAENPIPWEEIWPDLKLISCWDSANSADQAKGLRSQFPHVFIQGKGLLATEAPMTIPLIQSGGYVPVFDQVFFEFEDQTGAIHPLSDLVINQEYQIILSQKGGLYRYRIGDRIRVSHYCQNTPCLEFLGREENISDLVGEKLSEAFVAKALNQLNLPENQFKSLAPIADPPHYLLLLDSALENPEIIAQKLDQILSQSYHYHRARILDQLAPVKVLIAPEIPELLVAQRLVNGGIWGGIKHPILLTSPLNTKIFQV